MISCNPVKGSWQDIVFHLYMISHNPVKWLLVRYCIHSYMTSNNPVKGSWLGVISSFIKYYKKKYIPLKKKT